MADLQALLQRPELDDLRTAKLHELDFRGLDEITATRFRRMSARRTRGLTVAAALRKMNRRDRDVLTEWLWSVLGPGAREEELRPRMPRDALRRWAQPRGLEWAIEWSAEAFGVWGPFTVADVLCGHPQLVRGWSYDDQADRALRFLRTREEEATRAQQHVEARRATWSRPPDALALHGLWQLAWAAFERLGPTPISVLPDEEPSAVLDPPGVTFPLFGRQHVVPWDAEVLDLPAHPFLQPAFCIALLDAVHDPPPALLDELRRAPWERDLAFLDDLVVPDPLPDDEDKRLLGWEIAEAGEALTLCAMQCRYTRSGGLQGRRVDVAELPDALLQDPTDAVVASQLAVWKHPPPEIALEAIGRLAGHPRVVFSEQGRREPVEVRQGRLALRIARRGERLVTSFLAGARTLDEAQLHEALLRGRGVGGSALAVRQGDEVVVVRCTLGQRRFATEWLRRSSRLDLQALPGLLARLPALQQVCDVVLDPELRGQVVQGDDRTCWRLSYRKDALVVEARVQPVPDAPSFAPGDGPQTLHLVRGTEPACVVRDLREEPARVRAEAEAIGLHDGVEQRPFVWALDDRATILDVVSQLDPASRRLEIDGTLPRVARGEAGGLRLEVRSTKRDWFGMDGALHTPLGKVALAQVMAAVDEGRGWVAVGKNSYVRLEAALQQQLEALAPSRGSDRALSLLAVHTPLLEGLEQAGAVVEGASEWRELVDRIRAAGRLEAEVPAALRGELRPYQLEGFRWMAALAEWAPGAVLADDMGLGKTIQTIALLLRRASQGPALVVAPTSVVFNWRAELERFAPSMAVRAYQGPQRGEVLADLGPETVVLTSYGILQRDASELAGVEWATTVLDEAQAVKTPTSQRSRAAIGLQSGFRLALSGTPVENRAEELWSVFAAAVPGLLGPLASFRERFGEGDAAARRALARLVGPFVLRRTKRLVATDLPERTEQRELVALSDAHRVLYERARRDAIARIEDAEPKEQRFLVLAQLTRLRQLACDPRLVDPGSAVEGSKVAVVRERLRTVRDSGARALVFSSFVEHLKLLRAVLEADGFRVAWLTGSTPEAARRGEVERFQGGGADVFLISLKAGGTGLNLTAASYVFHLDPWWNPAAEDQATDRAHRIGQTEPVTVYRMVAADTIEQQILSMHDDKRDLVETLLSGSGSARPVDADELLALLSDPMGVPPGEQVVDPEPSPEVEPPGPEPEPDRLGAWLEEAKARLAARGLKPRTLATYRRALEQLVAWGRANTALHEVDGIVERYHSAIERGELPRSRRPMLSAALRGIA